MELRDTLQTLRAVSHHFDSATRSLEQRTVEIEYPHLVEIVNRLDDVRTPRRPISQELFRRQWTDYLKGQTETVPRSALRNLCWEPEIATQDRFIDLVASQDGGPSARTIQGLVYSQHFRWNRILQNPSIINRAQRLIVGFAGRNKLVRKWKENPQILLNPLSVGYAAEELFRLRCTPEELASRYGLFQETEFFHLVVVRCGKLCIQSLGSDSGFNNLLRYFIGEILAWPKAEISAYKHLITSAILSSAFDQREEMQEKLVSHILGDARLGDPRLPSNAHNWLGVDGTARSRVLQHLSRADIIFFFDHVMRGSDDRHGRKKFWLRYVKSMKQSRPLLNSDDRIRLHSVIQRKGGGMLHFGRTRGQYSAFLLDFGNVLAVEFNGVGACYLYDEQAKAMLFRDIYQDSEFSDRDLKQQAHAFDRIIHSRYWESTLQYVLSQHGIRPR